MSKFVRAAFGAPLLFAVPAVAQQAPSDQEIVVSAASLVREAIQKVNETPGGANVVAAPEFEDKLALSLRDALAMSPGVFTQPRYGQEVRLSIRGSGVSRSFHMRGLTLLQDGVPINLADDNGDFQELDPAFLQYIEVFRGANALRFGGSTLGGAVNGVTPTGRSANGVNLRVDGGSFNTLRGFASVGYADATGDAYLAIAADRSDGDRAHAERRAMRIGGNVGVRIGSGVTTRFYANYQNADQRMPGTLSEDAVLDRPWTGNFTGDQQRNIESIRVQNRTRFEFANGRLDVGGYVNAKQLDHPIFQVIDQKSVDWGIFARAEQDLGPLTLSAGTTARFGTMRSRRFVNVNGNAGSQTFDADMQARTIDTYAEGRVQPITGVTLIAGAVYTAGMRRQDQNFPLNQSARASFNQVSPKFGILLDPSAEVQLYANISRSHELPGYSELAQISTFVPLDAQRGWTAEVGGRGTVGPIRFDISLYRADLRGELLQFSVNPPSIPAATFNAGDTRHQGAEIGIETKLTEWASLRQSYMWNDFHFRDDAEYGNNRLPVIPQHVYRAQLRLGTDKLNVTPNLEWVPTGAWSDYANSHRSDGYALLGMGAQLRIGDRLSFFADARNLLNKHAVGDVGAAVQYVPGSSIFYPVERRSLFVGIRTNI